MYIKQQYSDYKTLQCPLCGSLSVIKVDSIQTSCLKTLYKRSSFGVDISTELGELKEFGYYRCNICDLGFYSPECLGSELFYEQLQKLDWYYLDNKPEYSIGSRYIRAGDAVLEVGCGKGAFAKLIESENYIGLELSVSAKAMAEENKIYVKNESIEIHAATNNGHYDVVCSFQVLEHVPDPSLFITACLACLKPGGILIISVPSEDSFMTIVENSILNMPPHHLTRWSDRALMWLIKQNALEHIAFEHETLADVHVAWYSREIVKAIIKRIFRIPQQSLSISIAYRLFDRLCTWMSAPYAKILTLDFLRPVGHSVTFVARKPFV